jgi:hypothetical protein
LSQNKNTIHVLQVKYIKEIAQLDNTKGKAHTGKAHIYIYIYIYVILKSRNKPKKKQYSIPLKYT